MKTCSKCSGPGPFNKSSLSADGLQRWCRVCQRKASAKRYEQDPNKYNKRTKEQSKKYRTTFKAKAGDRLRTLQRKWSLKHAYGIDAEEYARMHQAQGGLCAVCRQPETAKFRGALKNLAVDHCHVTGKVRGLLCNACNSLLGQSRDNPEVLRAAIKYLSRYSSKAARG